MGNGLYKYIPGVLSVAGPWPERGVISIKARASIGITFDPAKWARYVPLYLSVKFNSIPLMSSVTVLFKKPLIMEYPSSESKKIPGRGPGYHSVIEIPSTYILMALSWIKYQ